MMFYLKGELEETEQGKEPVKMSSFSAENIVEELEEQEPETPESRASIKFISYHSPEQINEKKENPSPVSVLEPLFEDIGSPDCIKKNECKFKLYNLYFNIFSCHP